MSDLAVDTTNLFREARHPGQATGLREAPARFVAALVQSAVITPLAATIVSVFGPVVAPVQDQHAALYLFGVDDTLFAMLLYITIVWLTLALLAFLIGLSSRARANAASFAQIEIRLDELLSKRSRVASGATTPEETQWIDEFCLHLESINDALRSEGVQWVTGDEYEKVWRLIHRAEEAWIHLESEADMGADLALARLRINGSNMPAEEGLVKDLDDLEKIQDLARKRARLKGIWRIIHDYRDERWNGLRRARNHLGLLTGLSGLAVYTALWLPRFATDPQFAANEVTIRWAAAVFLVGMVAGLLALLNKSRDETFTVPDDHGLSTARIISGLQTSGIAAGLAVGWIELSGDNGLAAAFDLVASPQNLAVAAAFGIAPASLLDRFTTYAQEKARDIKSTEASEQGNK